MEIAQLHCLGAAKESNYEKGNFVFGFFFSFSFSFSVFFVFMSNIKKVSANSSAFDLTQLITFWK